MSRGPKNVSEGKIEQILDAADRQFTRFGYRRTAMEDIAAEAGVAKGTLYIYFDSKESLFCRIQARNVEYAERLCDEAEKRGGDLSDQLFGQLEAWFGMMFDRYGASDHLAELSAARSSVSKKIAVAADKSFHSRLVRLIEAAHDAKKANIKAVKLEPARIVAALLSAARGSKYVLGKPVTPERYRKNLREIAHLFAAALQVI